MECGDDITVSDITAHRHSMLAALLSVTPTGCNPQPPVRNATCGRISEAEMMAREEEEMKVNPHAMQYLNPSKTRNLSIHANDTHNAESMNKHIKKALKMAGMKNCKVCYMQTQSSYHLPYAHCQANCEKLVQVLGGSAVWGWSIYEGKQCVELEAHVVYKAPDGGIYNVTTPDPLQCGQMPPIAGLFVVQDKDTVLANRVQLTRKLLDEDRTVKTMPPSKLYWK